MKKFFENSKGDFFGGLTAGIVAIPLAVAFGEQSGLGAASGLYGAAFIALLASIFGGTHTQISGPTAPMTVLSAAITADIVMHHEGDLGRAFPIILLVFLMAGLFQIVLGALKFGTQIRYIPRTVVSGFMTGIGLIIIATQITPSLGYIPEEDNSLIEARYEEAQEELVTDAFSSAKGHWLEFNEPSEGGFDIYKHLDYTDEDILKESKSIVSKESSGVIGSLRFIPRAFLNINWTELWMCLITIFIIYGFRFINNTIPSALVAIVTVTAGVLFLEIPFASISKINSGFPDFNLSMFSSNNVLQIGPYILSAFVLSLLGSIDSLLTSVVADDLTNTRHDPNKELVGQGIGNAISSMFGGLPGAGATIRTVVNINAGGRTKLSGIIAGLFIFLVIISLGPFISFVPSAVLSGILLTVGFGVIDYKGLKAFPKFSSGEKLVFLTVLTLTVLWQLVYAVIIGLIIASFQFMKYMGEWSSQQFRLSDGVDADHENSIIKKLHGPIFFGNAFALRELSDQIHKKTDLVIIDMHDVHFVDQSGVSALDSVITLINSRGANVKIVGLDPKTKKRLETVEHLKSCME